MVCMIEANLFTYATAFSQISIRTYSSLTGAYLGSHHVHKVFVLSRCMT